MLLRSATLGALVCFRVSTGACRYLFEKWTTMTRVTTAATEAETRYSVEPLPPSRTPAFAPAAPIGPWGDCGLGDGDVVAGADAAATVALADRVGDAEEVTVVVVVCVDGGVMDGDAPTDRDDVGEPVDVGVAVPVALPVAV